MNISPLFCGKVTILGGSHNSIQHTLERLQKDGIYAKRTSGAKPQLEYTLMSGDDLYQQAQWHGEVRALVTATEGSLPSRFREVIDLMREAEDTAPLFPVPNPSHELPEDVYEQVKAELKV